MKNCGGLAAMPRENLVCGVVARRNQPFTGRVVFTFPCRGRMHEAPTNRPGTAGERVKQASAADRPACERGRGFRTGARMSLAGSKESFA